MNDKILVRLMDDDNENTMISSFYTTNWSEVLKMYSFMKENELEYDIFVDDYGAGKYHDKVFFIKDIDIHFAGKNSLNTINIYVEVC